MIEAANMRLVDEVHFGGDRNDSAFMTHVQQLANGFAAVRAIVQRALIHVHAYEAAGQAGVEIARKLHGVFECLFAVVQGVLNAVAQRFGDDGVRLSAQGAANCIAAKGQHELGLLSPPNAEVDDFMQSAAAVGQLPFMNDQPASYLPASTSGMILSNGTTSVSISGLNIFKAR